MPFNSAIFVFAFLPVTLAVFYLLRRCASTRIVMTWLVLASLFFYGWANPDCLPLIILSVVVNYGLGLLTNRCARPKISLIIGIFFNLAFLGYFKYFNFFVDTIETVTGQSWGAETILLPLAISFFTFQQIAYQIDVYKKQTIEKNFIRYALFVTFFPYLTAGPIVRHNEITPQMETIKTQAFALHGLIFSGAMLFMIGLFKKVILADALAEFADPLFNADLTHYTPTAWEAYVAVLSYTGQIYFDFSGYCDMGMGIALLFGINLPINFSSPYKSRNISEFWRHWHITLGRFLRDYLYIPLGGNRVGLSKQMRNVIIVMFLGGLWHGANWTFVLWGLLHGFMLAIHAAWTSVTSLTIPRWPAVAITFACVSFSWIFFRADSLSDAWIIIQSLGNFDMTRLPEFYDAPFGLSGHSQLVGLTSFQSFFWLFIAFSIAFFAPNSLQIRDFLETRLSAPAKHIALGVGLATILLVMAINACKETNGFIYFNF